MLFPMVYHEKDQIFHQQIPVGGLEHFFPIILGIMILTDELIFFRGVGIPPTRYFKQGSPVLFPMAFPHGFSPWLFPRSHCQDLARFTVDLSRVAPEGRWLHLAYAWENGGRAPGVWVGS